MPVSMDALCTDLAAETAALRELLAPLDEQQWRLATPAPGWTIGDQVSHLAFFDDAAVQSALDPEAFRALAEREGAADGVAERFRDRSGAELLAWFDSTRARLIETFAALDPALRVPWFGPPMSAASSLTARIMETWAHGQDVADALGATREPTDRLRHVAHIGIGARPFSFMIHGREAPAEPIRVELTGPGGDIWAWGPAEADDRVTGPALDFCLVVTQRRHLGDTALQVTGAHAEAWMQIAQAFAGPPGTGRRQGEFA
ncbi:TIGR03084 family metal-binding protein [Pseudonocardia sp. GCM10023141]|uniref:TIGR03084 family metal-binding protein n=1 Tax=Pseudonocardia sp. GCM10023141 TaxID=3252653 RepID=UPI0036126E6A